jgi:MoxR-like ATPase
VDEGSQLTPGAKIELEAPPGAPEQVHVLGEDEVSAIHTALDAGRALLVRGEPGTGKTQLAKAAAKALGRAFVVFVVDARTEARDLLWYVDAVRRLADAQVGGALGEKSPEARAVIDIRKYLEPRALWWGLSWSSAANQATEAKLPVPSLPADCDPANGVVVLIDEIDKGESDVPNGLLEALGSAEFSAPGYNEPIRPKPSDKFPLVIVTTNEERVLPDAFVRRCVVLHLRLPDTQRDLIEHLARRGAAHFPAMSPKLLRQAASLLAQDRAAYDQQRLRPLPGQAEFIDLLRVLDRRGLGKATVEKKMLNDIARFVVRKHPDAAGQG